MSGSTVSSLGSSPVDYFLSLVEGDPTVDPKLKADLPDAIQKLTLYVEQDIDPAKYGKPADGDLNAQKITDLIVRLTQDAGGTVDPTQQAALKQAVSEGLAVLVQNLPPSAPGGTTPVQSGGSALALFQAQTLGDNAALVANLAMTFLLGVLANGKLDKLNLNSVETKAQENHQMEEINKQIEQDAKKNQDDCLTKVFMPIAMAFSVVLDVLTAGASTGLTAALAVAGAVLSAVTLALQESGVLDKLPVLNYILMGLTAALTLGAVAGSVAKAAAKGIEEAAAKEEPSVGRTVAQGMKAVGDVGSKAVSTVTDGFEALGELLMEAINALGWQTLKKFAKDMAQAAKEAGGLPDMEAAKSLIGKIGEMFGELYTKLVAKMGLEGFAKVFNPIAQKLGYNSGEALFRNLSAGGSGTSDAMYKLVGAGFAGATGADAYAHIDKGIQELKLAETDFELQKTAAGITQLREAFKELMSGYKDIEETATQSAASGSSAIDSRAKSDHKINLPSDQ